jgi:hypothetical protein
MAVHGNAFDGQYRLYGIYALPGLRQVSETQHRIAARFFRSHAGGHIVFEPHLDMRPKFRIDLPVHR